ncbi:LuxR C-terminal-related transcriptional regulator [Skermania piniformis]|uniref:LuxR C-terminal-related transcriptional regulator n=1 Tax=Skermania pinensis TaxID=39122 RepID=A0ABX8S3X9_9ACTN|nr:LuxR C-terminal-related transcriptional regulator [Skermania piniformis]QXQ12509.1 LuxR C-terminal-related transcriptional regulator [Skermania piniformis]
MTAARRVPVYADPGLSARELLVLKVWMQYETKGEVAEAMFIARGTVNTHLARVRKKYEAVGRRANTKARLLARALQDGHVRLEDL